MSITVCPKAPVYDTLNVKVLQLVLEDHREGLRILDVGCSTGRLGAELKGKISCFLEGVEGNLLAAKQAAAVYDKISLINLERVIDATEQLSSGEQFDYIIFGDILEHTTQPGILLDKFRGLLKDDGIMIVSVPNVANWMIRIKLLFGDFSHDQAILDKGHLRFFTYKTAREMIEKSGYKVLRVVNNNETKLLEFLGSLWKPLFAFQLVFKCCKISSS